MSLYFYFTARHVTLIAHAVREGLLILFVVSLVLSFLSIFSRTLVSGVGGGWRWLLFVSAGAEGFSSSLLTKLEPPPPQFCFMASKRRHLDSDQLCSDCNAASKTPKALVPRAACGEKERHTSTSNQH